MLIIKYILLEDASEVSIPNSNERIDELYFVEEESDFEERVRI